MRSGRHIGGNYFAGINGLTAFWQIDYGPDEGQVIAWGREGLAIPGCEPEGDSGGQLPEREAV